MASVLDLVKHYQHAIEKYPNDEQKILKCIDKLFSLKVTVQHLQETGVGRTVNALRKEPGEVGQAARALVNKWKLMVAAEESDEETDHNDTANHNGYGNGKDSDQNSKQSSQYKEEKHNRSASSKHDERNSYSEMNDQHSGSKRRHQSSEEEEPDVKKSKGSSDHNNRDSYRKSNVKVDPDPQSESESDDESDHSHSGDSSESEMSESTVEEVKVKQEIKTEPDYSQSLKHSSTRNEDHKRESGLKHSHESKSPKSAKPSSSVSKERHSSEKSSSKEVSHNYHKSTKEKESCSEKKHRTDNKEKDKKHKEESKSSKHSSSDKHNSDRHKSSQAESSTDKHKSSSQTDSSSDKYKTHNEKHSSKSEKHRSSSQSQKSDKDKNKSSSEKEIQTEKHKSKDRSSSSKEKHSSSSKEKSKDRSSSSKEKSNSHKSEKKHSSEKLKSSDKNKDKVDDKSKMNDKSDSRSKHKLSSSSHKGSKSTTNTSTDDIPKKTKQVNHSEDSDDGIDCGSGASFAEALGMISPAKPKKKSAPLKDSCSPSNIDLSPAALLAPHARLAPLAPLAPLEIAALPEISPNYRPRPPPRLLPHFTDEEAMSSIISSKNQRTKVYSGNKVFGKIPTLYEMCVHILQEHIDALEYTGGVPYEILKPVIDRATPQQLFLLEHYNPYLMEDTDHLWQKFCEKHFRKQQRQEMETWREMYMRCQEEQEHKLKSLTENIKIAQEAKKAPIKQTKMAYVDTVVKPPRNIARKQALHGTAHAASASPAARVASLAGAPGVLRGSARPAPVLGAPGFKPKRAPLMAKALQFMRGRKR